MKPINKNTWPNGPWMIEDDQYTWVDESTGYTILIRRVPYTGVLCGYVGVPFDVLDKFGVSKTDDYLYNVKPFDTLEVHGGLTFSGTWKDFPELYFFGFDCAHFMDLVPLFMSTHGFEDCKDYPVTYKTVDFVTKECRDLARQIKELETGRW